MFHSARYCFKTVLYIFVMVLERWQQVEVKGHLSSGIFDTLYKILNKMVTNVGKSKDRNKLCSCISTRYGLLVFELVC